MIQVIDGAFQNKRESHHTLGNTMGFKASPMFRDLLVFNWKAVVASLELPCYYHDQKCVLDQKQ